ncbi:hypothetical protein [Leisingera sp. ANG-DT]|uniref:hypothetical protein n=1 Tax=Leisingera sp. ANG-DT TaxID=1577897 RepID=UPI001269B338|nr:hypothetical protein [Leisingera sp. ANG-DT]
MPMGADARAVTFATSTSSETLLYPSIEELAEYKVTTPKGFGKWFLEPYKGGLVAAARPDLPTSLLVQATTFCRSSGEPKLLLTMKGFSTYSMASGTLPIDGAELTLDGVMISLSSDHLSARIEGEILYLTVNLPTRVAHALTRSETVGFRLIVSRAFGNFNETSSLDDLARKSIALSWRNCF